MATPPPIFPDDNSIADPFYVAVTDGVNVAGVTPPSTGATNAEPAEVVALSPNTPLPAGTNLIGAVGIVSPIPLPTNAAQESGGHLAAIDSKTPALIGGRVPVDAVIEIESIEIGKVDQGAAGISAWPVSVAILPLPSGAATEATLALVKAKTDNLDVALSTRNAEATQLLIKSDADNLPLIKAKTDNIDVALSTRNAEATQLSVKADLDEIALDTDNLALIKSKTDNLDVALSTRALESGGHLQNIDTKLPASLGQKNSAGSIAVVVASDQSAIPISAASLPLPPNAAQETGGNLAAAKTDLDSILADMTNGNQVVKTSDTLGSTGTITAQDVASTTTAVANGQNFITGTPTAGSSALFSISSFESIEVLISGTWTGTLQTEVSQDGNTWTTRGIKQSGVAFFSSSFTQNAQGGLNFAGMVAFRVRATAAWTGTANIKINASSNPASITVSSSITNADKSGSGTINANGGTLIATTNGCSSIVFNVTGSFTGAVVAQGFDGTTWTTINGIAPGGQPIADFLVAGTILFACGGYSQVRLISAFFSGSVAITWNAGSGTNLTLSPYTSSIIPGDTVSKYGMDVVRLRPTTGHYSTYVEIVQSATTAFLQTVFAMRNPLASSKFVTIEELNLAMSFNAATPGTRSTMIYGLGTFSGADPTGGTLSTYYKLDTGDAASVVTPIRFVDTGLSMTGTTLDRIMGIIGLPAVSGGPLNQWKRNNFGILLRPGQGFYIFLTTQAIIGQSLIGEIIWSERA